MISTPLTAFYTLYVAPFYHRCTIHTRLPLNLHMHIFRLLGGDLVDRLGKILDVRGGDTSHRNSAVLGAVDRVLPNISADCASYSERANKP